MFLAYRAHLTRSFFLSLSLSLSFPPPDFRPFNAPPVFLRAQKVLTKHCAKVQDEAFSWAKERFLFCRLVAVKSNQR